MGTDTFRRHTRTCVDAAIHRVFVSLRHHPDQRSLFERLLRAAQARSDLLRDLEQVSSLQNMLPFEHELVRTPETWAGATGHPLRVIHSLTSHLFGRHPTPHFLASVWRGSSAPDRIERRSWFIAHAQGRRFRSLALPMAMTRRMEHLFLKTPDHFFIDHALRRAEILGLGGSPELAWVIVTATRLAEDFSEPERWRVALAWLVGCGASIDLAQVGPLIDYLHANLQTVDLRGRTFTSVMRLVREWHAQLGAQQMRAVAWNRSKWREMVVFVEPTKQERRRAEWSIVELLDSRALVHEGREMRHCVASYRSSCVSKWCAIFSLRHRWCDDEDEPRRSVLTIEVRPATNTILQIRGKANAPASGWPLQLVRRWATRESLRFHRSLPIGEGVTLRQAA